MRGKAFSVKEFVEKVERYSECVIREELEYMRRRTGLDKEEIETFGHSLSSLNAKLMNPLVESIEEGAASPDAFLRNMNRIIDNNLERFKGKNEEESIDPNLKIHIPVLRRDHKNLYIQPGINNSTEVER